MPQAPAKMSKYRRKFLQFTRFTMNIGIKRPIFIGGVYCREEFLEDLLEAIDGFGMTKLRKRAVVISFSAAHSTLVWGRRNTFQRAHHIHGGRSMDYRIYNNVLTGFENNDPDIGRMLDRFVGVFCAAMFPDTKVPGYKGAAREQDYERFVEFSYQLPSSVLIHPAILHLLLGLGRDAMTMYGMGNQEYFLPVATDEEVAEALNGNSELAMEIVEFLLPNLSMTSRSFCRETHATLFRYIHKVGARAAFTEGRTYRQAWPTGGWHKHPKYWDGDHVNTLVNHHRLAALRKD